MARKKPCPQPGTRRYGTKSRYTEKELQEALEKIKKNQIAIRAASKIYNIPRSTLKNKLQDKHQRAVGRPQVLTDAEEQIIVSHVIALSDLGIPVGMQDVRTVVKRYLDDTKRKEPRFKNNLPGWEWGQLFLARHPVLQQKVANQISRKRAQVNKDMIEKYFENLSTDLADVPPENIYNFDETGFHDNPKKCKLLFRRTCRNPEVIINSTKSCYTVMFCASATGELIPPFIIYKAQQKWSDWILDCPPGTRMGVTKSGWIDAETFDEWFEKQLLPILKKKEGKKAVIGDNLSSHITIKTLQLCKDNDIKFICLLPNSTHLLQPLDVAYFSALKNNWRKVLGDWRQTRRGKIVNVLPKNVFAPLLKKTLELGKNSVSENVKAGFKACGIYPLDKEVVIRKLPNYGKPIEEIREDLGESFKNYLDEIRNIDLGTQSNRRKFQIPISAGKTVSVEEVQKYYEDREKNKSTENKKRGRPKKSLQKSKSTKVTTKKENKKKINEVPVRSSTPPTPMSPVSMEVLEKSNALEGEKENSSPPTSTIPSISDIQSNALITVDAIVHAAPKPKAKETSEIVIRENLCTEIQDIQENIEILQSPSSQVIEEYELQNDGSLLMIEPEKKPKSGFCIFKYEESLFPGLIFDFVDETYKISVLQKAVEGWKWPSKAETISCSEKDIVKSLEEHQITKRKNFYIIQDDFLFMEWGD